MPYLLTTLILLPVAGALIAVVYGMVARNRDDGHYKWIALGTTGLTFVVSLLLLRGTGWALNFASKKTSVGSARSALVITLASTA